MYETLVCCILYIVYCTMMHMGSPCILYIYFISDMYKHVLGKPWSIYCILYIRYCMMMFEEALLVELCQHWQGFNFFGYWPPPLDPNQICWPNIEHILCKFALNVNCINQKCIEFWWDYFVHHLCKWKYSRFFRGKMVFGQLLIGSKSICFTWEDWNSKLFILQSNLLITWPRYHYSL